MFSNLEQCVMGPKRKSRLKRFSIRAPIRPRRVDLQQPATSSASSETNKPTAASTSTAIVRSSQRQSNLPQPQPGPSRGSRISAAERIHGNKGYCKSVSELMRHHSRLQQQEPAESTRDVFTFTKRGRRGTLIQTHVRFRADYNNIQQHLISLFTRLFALRGDNNDPFEVVITFNAILYCQDAGTYSLFYGTDHRENNRMGAACELGHGDTFVVRDLSQVTTRLPMVFDLQNVLHSHRNAFPHSNVRVHQIVNIIYLIYQVRE